MRNFYVILFLVAALPCFVTAQDWELVSKETNYSIEKRTEVCVNEKGTVAEYVFLKFNNLTANEMEMTFQLPYWISGKYNANLKDGETEKILVIPANGSVEGECDMETGTLKLYSKLISMESTAVLTDFKIEDVTIK